MTGKELVVRKPKVIKVDTGETLAQFILRHLTPQQVDALLDRIDTHAKHGKGEKSRV